MVQRIRAIGSYCCTLAANAIGFLAHLCRIHTPDAPRTQRQSKREEKQRRKQLWRDAKLRDRKAA